MKTSIIGPKVVKKDTAFCVRGERKEKPGEDKKGGRGTFLLRPKRMGEGRD